MANCPKEMLDQRFRSVYHNLVRQGDGVPICEVDHVAVLISLGVAICGDGLGSPEGISGKNTFRGIVKVNPTVSRGTVVSSSSTKIPSAFTS